ncbi:homoserine acetyltransferase [Whalleya microplaca]|nr:homoserine acetyltransferase [Whalleya microplaca]
MSQSSASKLMQTWPTPIHGDFKITDFSFDSGEKLSELSLHYQTIGSLKVSVDGETSNAILIMHGTGGSSNNFLNDNFAGQLFNPGQILDAQKYFIIIRDGIGHGESSKPSNSGLRARFPHYQYNDMIHADYRLLTEHLGINHVRLIMGTSMGGMHTWLWGETYPEFMDALMPLASLPIQISGRNRMWRKMVMESIRSDPAWKGGDYSSDAPPVSGLTSAMNIMIIMGSAPLYFQLEYPTRDLADKWLEDQIREGFRTTDANDLLYALDASHEYDPKPDLGKIKAPLTAVNSADDQINPPELEVLETEVRDGMKEGLGKAVVLPITKHTRGHGSHTIAKLWKKYLGELLVKTERKSTISR